MDAEQKLMQMGLHLPLPPQPAGSYTRAVRSGDLLFVSGQLPLVNGAVVHPGRLGDTLQLEEGAQAARICALNALAVLKAELGSLEAVARIVRLGGFVCSSPAFTDQAKVINGASDLMAAVLGDRGIHARLAVGVTALPLGAAVELEVIAQAA